MQARRAARAKTRVCGACGLTKPKTREHWSPASYWPDGSVRHWATWCKPCQAAYQRDKYATDPERRRRHREAAARQRARGGGAAKNPGRAQRPARRRGRAPLLDPAPLVEVVERAARAHGTEDDACAALGIDARQLYDWRHGQRVHLDVADRVLLGTDYLLEDVWPELAAIG